ncbi:uncharacterized protein BDR25DRAFT_348371 [Lindgomyces ingoldianus]|uniref:Uncharacterized protein n=1 Tax=Lindgomyces ingoldianus TaxID=673940 RepID=A0ACB6RHY4_9PLEO|nr:uncharacterized protein BDR25DRAFT_348371 [Lindgomyces ingoldianus]KAF2478086.1 hypothetical protein BDR25DRAFT_348371 [Lindgomyces ingoldianus]
MGLRDNYSGHHALSRSLFTITLHDYLSRHPPHIHYFPLICMSTLHAHPSPSLFAIFCSLLTSTVSIITEPRKTTLSGSELPPDLIHFSITHFSPIYPTTCMFMRALCTEEIMGRVRIASMQSVHGSSLAQCCPQSCRSIKPLPKTQNPESPKLSLSPS